MPANNAANIAPHPHPDYFNIALCCSCGGKLARHTASDAEKRCNPRKQPPSFAVLWCAIKPHTHIKSATTPKQNPTAPIGLRKSPFIRQGCCCGGVVTSIFIQHVAIVGLSQA
ncbi:MAG: hypothetical protein ACQCN4_04385 [Candidatus Bathyarchaeia archaeon]